MIKHYLGQYLLTIQIEQDRLARNRRMTLNLTNNWKMARKAIEMNQLNVLTSKNYARQMYFMSQEFYGTYLAVEKVQKIEKVQSPEKPSLLRQDFLAMKHFLLCHALELALKSLLIDTSSYKEQTLKKAFGHDLEKLANEVKRLYNPLPEVDACTWFIQVLNPDYHSKGYEYPINGGKFTGVEHDKFAVVIESLISVCVRSIESYKYPDKPLP